MPAVLDRRFQIETEHPKKNGHQLASSSGKSRATPVVDLAAIEQAVRTILEAVGEDPDRDGLLETPPGGSDVCGDVLWTDSRSGRGICESPFQKITTRWSWFETSASPACASIICSLSLEWLMSRTSRTAASRD